MVSKDFALTNNEKISRIVMHPQAICKCKIGQDWYKNQFEVVFYPNMCYPDYMAVLDWIEENLSGKELNIEQAVAMLWDYLKLQFDPSKLIVTSKVDDAITHFPVEVTKE